MTCIGPDCTKPASTAGLCAAHYQQQRRGGQLKPLRTGAETEHVTFRCSAELKSDAAKAAKREHISVNEWWRRAGTEKLK